MDKIIRGSQVVLDIIDSREGMIKALVQSRMSKTLIGVRSPQLGPGTYFTTVVEIQMPEDDGFTVKLVGYDMTGYVFDKNELKIEDIDYVIPLNAIFENPYVRDLGREVDSEASTASRDLTNQMN